MKNPIITISNPPSITHWYSVVGHMEKNGPLGNLFDEYSTDDKFGQETWEKAETEMQRLALNGALKKGGLDSSSLDALLAGDLMNQCTVSSYASSGADIPFLGLYGACSTCAEGLALGACLCGFNAIDTCGVVTSSHYCASERQFRFPLEYGGQRTPTSQWTTTGAGAFILGNGGNIKITEALFGRVVDKGISDINNMGAAMAPAAIDTLVRYFKYSGYSPDYFDMIVTGDLGYEGSGILKELLLLEGFDIYKNHLDCGTVIFDKNENDVHAGGSGCGCSASVLAASILPYLERGDYKNVLFLGTGALMSPISLFQGEAIPAICHLVHLSSC